LDFFGCPTAVQSWPFWHWIAQLFSQGLVKNILNDIHMKPVYFHIFKKQFKKSQ
jgi:hypothetical protein